MKIIVGLGNPGKKYEGTRHNVGFLAVDHLQKEWNFKAFSLSLKWKTELSEGEWNGEKIFLAQPQTYMNLSGEAVQTLVHFYKIPFADLWIIYDDVDLPLGKIRIREKGSPGTHNGMKSVVAKLGTTEFPRFRFGIESRKGELGSHDTTSFVLSKFKPGERTVLKKTLEKMTEAIEFALKNGLKKAMDKFNP